MMKVVFKKTNQSYHQLIIIRADKSTEQATLHTNTFFLHDICHLFVEMELSLKDGFWGMLERGYRIEQLGGKTNELTEELRLIEHVVGSTQSVYWGHMTEDAFWQAIQNKNYAISNVDFLNIVISEIKNIMNRWKYLSIGEVIEVEFRV